MKKSAEAFFTKLKLAGVKRIIDVRLNNSSQLAGFAKKADLTFLAKAVCNIEYMHIKDLAPTQDILDAFKKHKGDWGLYENQFLGLMEIRQIENKFSREMMDSSGLLCSEDKPHHCHRRLVAEYLRKKWGNIEIEHLM